LLEGCEGWNFLWEGRVGEIGVGDGWMVLEGDANVGWFR